MTTQRGAGEHDGNLAEAQWTVESLLNLYPACNDTQKLSLINFLVNHLSGPLAAASIKTLDEVMVTISQSQLTALIAAAQTLITQEHIIEKAAHLLQRLGSSVAIEQTLQIVKALTTLIQSTPDNGQSRDFLKAALVQVIKQTDPQYKNACTYGIIYSASQTSYDMSVRLALLDVIGEVHYERRKQFLSMEKTYEKSSIATLTY